MQPQESPARVLLGLHGDCTEGFLLKNLCCLDWYQSVPVYLFVLTCLFISAWPQFTSFLAGRRSRLWPCPWFTLDLRSQPGVSCVKISLIERFFIKPNWEWNHTNTSCMYHAGLPVFAVVTVYIRVEKRPKSRLCCAAIPRKTKELLVKYFIIHKPMFSIGMNFLQLMWLS